MKKLLPLVALAVACSTTQTPSENVKQKVPDRLEIKVNDFCQTRSEQDVVKYVYEKVISSPSETGKCNNYMKGYYIEGELYLIVARKTDSSDCYKNADPGPLGRTTGLAVFRQLKGMQSYRVYTNIQEDKNEAETYIRSDEEITIPCNIFGEGCKGTDEMFKKVLREICKIENVKERKGKEILIKDVR